MVDVGIEPVDRRGDQNDRRNADQDAENGQAGAHLVLAQRIQRHLDGFSGLAGGSMCASAHSSARSAVIGSSALALCAG